MAVKIQVGHYPLGEHTRREPQQLACIGHVHIDEVLCRAVISEVVQEGRGSRPAACGINHQVCGEDPFCAAATGTHTRAPVTRLRPGGREIDDVVVVVKGDVVNTAYPLPDKAFQQRACLAETPAQGLWVGHAAENMAAEREVRFGRVGAVEDWCSTGDELGEKSRKELVENPRAAGSRAWRGGPGEPRAG